MDTKNKFTGKAEVYSKYRPNYPVEYIHYLVETNRLTAESSIADIGSGTGILTKQLLDKNLKVIAVEPNQEMRAAAESTLSSYTNFQSQNGTAENTGILNNSIDLITVAQAFHWFDKEKFKFECQRILKSGCNVALVWNSRDYSSNIVSENAEVIKKTCPEFKGFSGGIEETPEIYADFFENGQYEFKEFKNDLIFDLDGFIGRNLSASFAPKVNDNNYNEFINELTAFFYKYSKNNQFIMPNVTRSYIGKV